MPSFVKNEVYKPIATLKPDVFCVQEIRTQEKIKVLRGYHHFWHPGERNGYFGTLTMTKVKPLAVKYGMGRIMPDTEGRVLTVEFEKSFVVNCYAPRSEGSLRRHDYRMEWDKALRLYFKSLLETGKMIILCGDFNVARWHMDVYFGNVREQYESDEYVSDERSAFRKLLKSGLMDVFRYLYPDRENEFTWWSNRQNNRVENKGWRLDYFLVSLKHVEYIKKMYHLREIEGSDHAPIYLSVLEPDNYEDDMELAAEWKDTDWRLAEDTLEEYQCQITYAAMEGNSKQVAELQGKLVNEPLIRRLAVRHISQHSATPGIDNVRWTTGAEKYRAATALESDTFMASPMKQVIILDKRNHKERHMGLPIFFDRAMHVLHGYALSPVAEVMDDRYSFGFRKGRSTMDLHACIIGLLEAKNAPDFVFYGDVKACYDNILHNWLMANVPMDKHVLREMLGAGHFISGSIVPADGHGLSQGSNISPIIANVVMTKLQYHIYYKLETYKKPDGQRDYANGRLIRYIDDILVLVRSRETGYKVMEAVADFLRVRGLELSQEKLGIASVSREGFTFLGRTYKRKDYYVRSEPSPKAVDRFIETLDDAVKRGRNKSQRDLIKSLNKKLNGWASYHRITDALTVFKHIDNVLETLLVKSVMERHPKMQPAKALAKYFYKDHKKRHIFALKDDKSVQVIRLEDTLLIRQQQLAVKKNPYIDAPYFESRLHREAIRHVNATYRPIWERQEGRCLYCGNKILPDQDRTLAQIDLRATPSLKNSAYIHKFCETHEFDFLGTMDDPQELRHLPTFFDRRFLTFYHRR